MYREGLARFGTDKFSLNDLRNPYRHLTNCSINKLGPGYTEMKERIGAGKLFIRACMLSQDVMKEVHFNKSLKKNV